MSWVRWRHSLATHHVCPVKSRSSPMSQAGKVLPSYIWTATATSCMTTLDGPNSVPQLGRGEPVEMVADALAYPVEKPQALVVRGGGQEQRERRHCVRPTRSGSWDACAATATRSMTSVRRSK
ncbi:MAG: hypothetical protein HOW71_40765 [Nonomuraea sp.]|nr:hypothetical protein [Nonomuraea sp.]